MMVWSPLSNDDDWSLDEMAQGEDVDVFEGLKFFISFSFLYNLLALITLVSIKLNFNGTYKTLDLELDRIS